jgi:hypothetical protein
MKHDEIRIRLRSKLKTGLTNPLNYLKPFSERKKIVKAQSKALREVLKAEGLYTEKGIDRLKNRYEKEIPKISNLLSTGGTTLLAATFFGLTPFTQIDIRESIGDPGFGGYMSAVWRLIFLITGLVFAASLTIYFMAKLSYLEEEKMILLLEELSLKTVKKK